MISVNAAPMSCGIKLLGGEVAYTTAEVWMKDFASLNYQVIGNSDLKQTGPMKQLQWSQSAPATYTQFIFSHAPSKSKMGKAIEAYIVKHGLGSIVCSELGNNPVHESKICVWVWTRDNKAFEAHAKILLLKEEDMPKPEATP